MTLTQMYLAILNCIEELILQFYNIIFWKAAESEYIYPSSGI